MWDVRHSRLEIVARHLPAPKIHGDPPTALPGPHFRSLLRILVC